MPLSCDRLAVLMLATAIPMAVQAQNTPDIYEGTSEPPLHKAAIPGFSSPTGYFPVPLRAAYGFNRIPNQGSGQTIAIVDAFDDPNIESDLAVFDAHFNIDPCTTANGCFKKVYAAGVKPPKDAGWAVEISLDVEWSHAIAPQANILLVEAASNKNADLYHAVGVAIQHGASVVSMSWGGGEAANEVQADIHFNVPGVTFVASSGDSGHGVIYPAASPFVVGVGGTSLLQSRGVYQSETAWVGSGGGVSAFEPEPSYQAVVQRSGKRGVPDVAYDADPNTGVPIYDSIPFSGVVQWSQWGGTSIGAPQIAALIAIANSHRVAHGKSTLDGVLFHLYDLSGVFHDISTGSNGVCPRCVAKPGYDFVTGLGSPIANDLLPKLFALP